MKALITGAASGIGRAVASRFAQDSLVRDGVPAQLLLVDINGAQLQEVAAEVEALNAEVSTFVGDLTDPTDCANAVEAGAQAFSGLDVLVSNAGTSVRKPLLELSVSEYDMLLALNTRATWLLGKAAHHHLKRSKGCIVATTSIAAEHPVPFTSVYSASKAALLMLVRQMALEWGPDGIRCNCVSPGSTLTALSEKRYATEELRQHLLARIPIGILGMPEHQAAAISFLASSDAAYISGTNLIVDGGMQTTMMQGSGEAWKMATATK